ncbi:hypothetical protein DL93DRAFT_2230401 [Clavulina sp. PMI_390]|nr:hypothetical protein DL93DRAFT_2230401 [Clavulina sp. PMI_390]
MSTASTDASMATSPPYFSLSDGDIVMKSSDGISFRLDSVYLCRSSAVFQTMLSLPVPIEEDHKNMPETIELAESAPVLDYVFRALYPFVPSRLIDSADHAVNILQALEKYEISIDAHTDMLSTYIGSVEPPIRAWALAVKAGGEAARAVAVRRFMEVSGDGLEAPVPELKVVDSWQLMHLLVLKKQANTKAQELISQLLNTITCDQHRIPALTSQATQNPFTLSAFTEPLIQEYKRIQSVKSSCDHCIYAPLGMWGNGPRRRRDDPRARDGYRQAMLHLLENVVKADRLGRSLSQE